MIRPRDGTRGSLLLDALVAVAIASVIALALGRALAAAQRARADAGMRLRATLLAAAAVESHRGEALPAQLAAPTGFELQVARAPVWTDPPLDRITATVRWERPRPGAVVLSTLVDGER